MLFQRRWKNRISWNDCSWKTMFQTKLNSYSSLFSCFFFNSMDYVERKIPRAFIRNHLNVGQNGIKTRRKVIQKHRINIVINGSLQLEWVCSLFSSGFYAEQLQKLHQFHSFKHKWHNFMNKTCFFHVDFCMKKMRIFHVLFQKIHQEIRTTVQKTL